MKIVIVGAGNTATVLGRVIDNAQHHIVQVVSRNADNAKALAMQFNTAYGSLSDARYFDADIYIAALADRAIENLDKYPALIDKFIVHTTGAVPMEVLEKCSTDYGVLYPLQTLSKFIDHTPEIPLLVDANNEQNLEKLMEFARSLSAKVSHTSDKERMEYHIAAVFAGNYANHMYALAEIYCQQSGLDFKQLLPLMKEVTQKAGQYSPFLTQTGPAIRDDVFTLSKHMEALSKDVHLKYMYLKLAESIIKIHGKR